MDSLLQALRTATAMYAADSTSSALETENPWMSRPLPGPIIEPVLQAIAVTPNIQVLTGLRQFSLGSSEVKPLYPRLLASALVRRTHALSGPETAVQELLDLVAGNTGHARVVMVLAGVQISEPTEVEPGVQLASFKDLLPPSWMKDFVPERWPLSRTFDPVAPSAALVAHIPFTPLFGGEGTTTGNFPEKTIAQLRTLAHCIALTAERPAAIFKVWFENDDPRLPLISSGVAFSDPRWGSTAAEPYVLDLTRFRATVASYRAFHGDLHPIETALARLTEAWGGWRREERAIDLGIALEAILMYTANGRNNDKSEINYKLRTRAAWLLGRNLSDRQTLFQQVGRLYQFRSDAAHSGIVKTSANTWQKTDDAIEAGIVLMGRIIATVLELGMWPDWDEIVLGGGSFV